MSDQQEAYERDMHIEGNHASQQVDLLQVIQDYWAWSPEQEAEKSLLHDRGV